MISISFVQFSVAALYLQPVFPWTDSIFFSRLSFTTKVSLRLSIFSPGFPCTSAESCLLFMSSVRHILTERFPKLYLYPQMLSFPQQVEVRADSASTLLLLFSHARRNKSQQFVLHKSDIQFTAIGVRGERRVKGQRGAGFEHKGSRGGFNAAKGRDVLIFKLNSPPLIPWKRSWCDEHNSPPDYLNYNGNVMLDDDFFYVLTVINPNLTI